jgi:GNAT superfamily N-acetyltransferase
MDSAGIGPGGQIAGHLASDLELRAFAGAGIAPHLATIAGLRARVLAGWPYLRAPDPAAELAGLDTLAGDDSAVAVLAFDAGTAVGAATAQRLDRAGAGMAAAFAMTDLPPEQTMLMGEAVLLPDYRGQGAGHVLIAARERHARRLGLRWSVLATYDRPGPRPAGWGPLDPFWRARGYRPLMGVGVPVSWREIGAAAPQGHMLDLWVRDLTAP